MRSAGPAVVARGHGRGHAGPPDYLLPRVTPIWYCDPRDTERQGHRGPTSPRQPPGGADREASDDGRSTRWSAHREARRAELVEAAVAAIDRHGPLAGIEDIAAAAGVSKPVLYRYFSDKADLHAAVGAWGADLVLERLTPALLADGTLRERVDLGCDAYLALIEEHPNVFLLLVQHRVGRVTRRTTRWPTARQRSPPPSPG